MKALHQAYEDLDALYRSPRSDDEKRALKEARLTTLQQTLGLRRRYNNADLAGYRTYDTGGPAFARLRKACGGLPKFVEAVRSLKATDFASPQQPRFDDVVDALAARECQGK